MAIIQFNCIKKYRFQVAIQLLLDGFCLFFFCVWIILQLTNEFACIFLFCYCNLYWKKWFWLGNELQLQMIEIPMRKVAMIFYEGATARQFLMH